MEERDFLGFDGITESQRTRRSMLSLTQEHFRRTFTEKHPPSDNSHLLCTLHHGLMEICHHHKERANHHGEYLR